MIREIFSVFEPVAGPSPKHVNQDASPEGLSNRTSVARSSAAGSSSSSGRGSPSLPETGPSPRGWGSSKTACRAASNFSSRFPDGWGNGLRAKLRSGDAEDLLYVADEVARALGAPTDGEYRRWLRETIGGLRAEHREVIAALSDLDVLIATTNYDSLIEEVTGLEPVTWRRRSHRAGAP